MNELDKKISNAIRLLQSYKGEQPIEVAYSGGKDSDVILELAKMAGINYRAIYKCTTIDPPHTIAHCKSNGVEIRHPKERFFDLVKRKGAPTWRVRYCCDVLKEYKILDNVVLGIRRDESKKREKLYQEPIQCRNFRGSKKNHVNMYLPILDWNNNDLVKFIELRGIKCHPLYYDEQGNFHVERRLGCIGCPMQSDRGKSDFKKYPKFLRRLIQCEKIYLKKKPDCGAAKKFEDAYRLTFNNLFCDSYGEFIVKTQPNLFGEEFDAKQYLEQYFGIEL